ncbi:nucleoside triphosphate pyrophosphohydrolase [Pseudohongiella acticola]|uniref:Nucleoside triphosphate pyrophosphohydrolase n=2 Tax=Pseudohongiella acticola TaxID=1524254 RepID=A0A1E8CNN0_9GAMM|nr:nucleoside triphosphate pyrophosphohydrolase [Pseudohongiella acticola]
MACLRDPEHGCAWDRKQTLSSLTRHTLEEVYEVIDAVEQGDSVKICDELGDLLFQVVFYARIAEESGSFDLGDVADAILRKLLHRHPHIFPDGSLTSFGQPTELSADDVERNWELIKNAERENAARGSEPVSVLDDVASALPAIERAGKLQKRASSVGFDWQETSQVLSCLQTEIAELQEALANSDSQAQEHELGDVLFTCVNLARHLKADPETALRRANQRFERRFRHLETSAREAGSSVAESTAETLEHYWQAAKRSENQKY